MIRDWHDLVGTYNGIVVLTVAAAPLAVLAVCLLALRRSARGATTAAVPWRISARVWRLSIADVGMVCGTLPWVWMTMLPGSGAGEVPGRVSLIPFRDLLSTSVWQIVGNLLVFAALGFFAPLRFPRLASLRRVVGLAAGCSVLIELTQYVLRLDRVTSVDDVLLNAFGAGLAALASRPWWRSTFRGHIENRIRTGNTTSS